MALLELLLLLLLLVLLLVLLLLLLRACSGVAVAVCPPSCSMACWNSLKEMKPSPFVSKERKRSRELDLRAAHCLLTCKGEARRP